MKSQYKTRRTQQRTTTRRSPGTTTTNSLTFLEKFRLDGPRRFIPLPLGPDTLLRRTRPTINTVLERKGYWLRLMEVLVGNNTTLGGWIPTVSHKWPGRRTPHQKETTTDTGATTESTTTTTPTTYEGDRRITVPPKVNLEERQRRPECTTTTTVRII